jgi:hypothetical protein
MIEIVDLDGNSHKWSLKGHIAKGSMKNKSSLHLQARQLIKDLFPTLQILEEVSIPIRKNETLFLDFYLPLTKTCIEVHGEQHYKFVQFYHNNALGFMKHKKRDRDKKYWCEKNDISYIELPYNESLKEWEKRINHE